MKKGSYDIKYIDDKAMTSLWKSKTARIPEGWWVAFGTLPLYNPPDHNIGVGHHVFLNARFPIVFPREASLKRCCISSSMVKIGPMGSCDAWGFRYMWYAPRPFVVAIMSLLPDIGTRAKARCLQTVFSRQVHKGQLSRLVEVRGLLESESIVTVVPCEKDRHWYRLKDLAFLLEVTPVRTVKLFLSVPGGIGDRQPSFVFAKSDFALEENEFEALPRIEGDGEENDGREIRSPDNVYVSRSSAKRALRLKELGLDFGITPFLEEQLVVFL